MATMVTHDGKPVAYVKNEDMASRYIQRHQPMSVDWAMRHEGWAVSEAPAAPDNTTHHLVPVGHISNQRYVCEYCNGKRYQLVADIGDDNVTDYQCPQAL